MSFLLDVARVRMRLDLRVAFASFSVRLEGVNVGRLP